MTTDYRALCAELLDELELWSSWHDATDLKDRAGAALHFTQPEPQPPAAIVEMVNKLHQINNPAPLAQLEPVAPTDEELTDMAEFYIEDNGLLGLHNAGEFARAVLALWGTPATALLTPEATNA
jgi:hypothetical protein